MEFCLGFRCSFCFTEYDLDNYLYVCPKDGANLDVILDIRCIKQNYPPADIIGAKEASLWRYIPLLPINDPQAFGTPLRSVGWTPIYKSTYLTRLTGHSNLWVKDDSRNPTASLKDRASALVVAVAREMSADIVVTASTGNAGAALAGMSAAIGQKSVIIAPKNAPPAKIAQLLVYGAHVILVDGSYDDAFDLSIIASKEFNWYCRNTGYNPYTVEGKKTVAYEIWEFSNLPSNYSLRNQQLTIFVSVGDGNIITGIHKGFKDLLELGWIQFLPRIFGVQAEGSAAVTKSFLAGGSKILSVISDTIADSISVNLPRDGMRAIRAMKESGASPILVSDQEILDSIGDLGRAGIFAEPASAAAFAGFKKAKNQRLIGEDDPVVIINTGSGLKDINSVLRAVDPAPIIQPTMKELEKVVKSFFTV
jgi:threonine synthase